MNNKNCISLEEIKKVYEHWKNALIKNDLSTLEKLHADNFSWTNTMGITSNKIEYLFRISSGNVKFLSLKDENVEIAVEQNNATLQAREILNMLVYGQAVSTVRDIIATFRFHDGKWLLSRIEERRSAA